MKNFDKILPKLLAIPIEVLLLQAQGIDIIFQGLVVQLVRMPPCHGGGRGFESRPDRKTPEDFRGFFVSSLKYLTGKPS